MSNMLINAIVINITLDGHNYVFYVELHWGAKAYFFT
jgi:hypothetical protein